MLVSKRTRGSLPTLCHCVPQPSYCAAGAGLPAEGVREDPAAFPSSFPLSPALASKEEAYAISGKPSRHH